MSTKISSELAPAAIKTMKLKQHIKELNLKLGFTEDQANFNMHCEAEEWECLGPSTSNMLKKNFVGAEEESEDCDPDKKEDNNA